MDNFTSDQSSTLVSKTTGDDNILPDEEMVEFRLSTLPYILLELIIMMFIAFGNILVLVAVRKFPKLRTSTNMFVVSLTVADLLVALLVLPLHILIYIFPSLKIISTICLLRYCVVVVSCGSSALTLLLISVDRFIAIEKPYQYQTLMSKTRSKIMCACIWIYTIVYGSLPLCGWNNWTPGVECTFTIVLPSTYITYIICNILVAVVVMAVLNGKIFRTANSISAEINQQIRSVGNNGISKGRQLKNATFVKNRKAAKALAVVIGAYSICTLPFALVVVWELSVISDPTYLGNIPSWVDPIRIITTFLSFINSGINPLIYHRRIPEFREAFQKLLCIKSRVADAGRGGITTITDLT